MQPLINYKKQPSPKNRIFYIFTQNTPKRCQNTPAIPRHHDKMTPQSIASLTFSFFLCIASVLPPYCLCPKPILPL
ncbi:hypothetical protein Barb4_00617 [Bacteroidales bacterium Barb4]|nr:hypothetical protein Barb4_00617 [Bacteroidales bacterium Barb4]